MQFPKKCTPFAKTQKNLPNFSATKKNLTSYSKTPKDTNKVAKKTTVRSLEVKTTKKVIERDNYSCILCGSNKIEAPHHAYFGLDTNRGENRNDETQLVTLCTDCHYDIHSKGDTEKREKCITYLKNIYG